jgi:hypothetical protein
MVLAEINVTSCQFREMVAQALKRIIGFSIKNASAGHDWRGIA